MDVGVADAGVGDVDEHVVGADIPAVDGAALEGLAGGVDEKGGGRNGHERILSRRRCGSGRGVLTGPPRAFGPGIGSAQDNRSDPRTSRANREN